MYFAGTAQQSREQMVRFSGELSAGLPKVARRFVAEMVFGIQARGSVRLTEVGRALGERISLKKTIVGANIKGTKLVPLFGRLFSHAVGGHESENEEIREAVREVAEVVGRHRL